MLGLGGAGVIGSLAISQIVQHSEDAVSTTQRLTSGSIDRSTLLQLTSVKLNDRGELIDAPPSQAQIFQEDLGNGVFLSMVKIPSGKFLMGSPANEEGCQPQEQPQHMVEIPEFYLGQTQVTQAQWAAIYPDKALKYSVNGQLPVHSINWLDAIAKFDRIEPKNRTSISAPQRIRMGICLSWYDDNTLRLWRLDRIEYCQP